MADYYDTNTKDAQNYTEKNSENVEDKDEDKIEDAHEDEKDKEEAENIGICRQKDSACSCNCIVQ